MDSETPINTPYTLAIVIIIIAIIVLLWAIFFY